MNEEQLQAIEERANKATPGPWEEVAESGEWWITGPDIDTHYVMSTNAGEIQQENVDFIAHAREDVPALIAEVRRLTQVVGIARANNQVQDMARESLRDTVSVLTAERDAARAEVMICHGLLEGLTPGGSEFSGWPERCAAWVQERLDTRAKIAAERNELRAKLDAVPVEAIQHLHGPSPVIPGRIESAWKEIGAWLQEVQP